MLRTFKPLHKHPVFDCQLHVQHLICDVWCRATTGTDCQTLLTAEFEEIYTAREWVKEGVDDIYQLCETLTIGERTQIKEAFFINNEIEAFCEASKKPVELDVLPVVVEQKMKPLLVRFYKDLLSAKDKLDYYNKLIMHNGDNKFCHCCGLIPIESAESHYREDNDHYLPKAEYPFASVNFGNLVPLCSKCNKKCKSTKNPFEKSRKSFYPFKPLASEFKIAISIKNTQTTDYSSLLADEVELSYNNDVDKVNTWHWLFGINTRYNEEVRQFSKTELRTLATKFRRNEKRQHGDSYEQILNDAIEDYEIDKYDDRKFLKKEFIKEMLGKPEWLAVYV